MRAYIDRDARRLHIHSCNSDGQLAITFTIEDADVFHDLCEGREPPVHKFGAGDLPPAA